MADITILDQVSKQIKTMFAHIKLPYHQRYQRTIHIVSASPVDHKNKHTQS